MKPLSDEKREKLMSLLGEMDPQIVADASSAAEKPKPERHVGPVWRAVLIAAAAVLLVGVMLTASILGNIAWKKYHPVGSAGMVSSEAETTVPPEVTSSAENCTHKWRDTVYKAPTCTETGSYTTVCYFCGEVVSYVEIEKVPHKQHLEITNPTCTSSGIGRSYCENCGILLHEYELPPEHRLEGEREVKPTCIASGSIQTYCRVCGEILAEELIQPPTGIHEFTGKTTEPTCTTDGERCEHCIYCGLEKPVVTLPRLGHDYDADGNCTRCGMSTTGLAYRLNEDGLGYTFCGCAANYSGAAELIIPAEYQGKPVTAVYFGKYDEKTGGSIGYFSSCITRIVLPATVKRLEYGWVWDGDDNVTSVVLPEGLEYIGYGVLKDSSLTELTIPSTVQYIGSKAFACCNSLQKLDIRCKDAEIAETAFLGVELYDRMIGWDGPIGLEWKWTDEFPTLFVTGPGTFRESVLQIPDTYRGVRVGYFADEAFRGCDFLEEVRLPKGLTNAQMGGGVRAFADCTRLKTAILPGEDDVMACFMDGFFAGCTALETVILPKNVEMYYCTDVFAGCTSLKTVTYGGTRAEWTEMMAKATRWSTHFPTTPIPEGTVIRCTDGDLIAGASWTDYTWVE